MGGNSSASSMTVTASCEFALCELALDAGFDGGLDGGFDGGRAVEWWEREVVDLTTL